MCTIKIVNLGILQIPRKHKNERIETRGTIGYAYKMKIVNLGILQIPRQHKNERIETTRGTIGYAYKIKIVNQMIKL
jgi:uncharacterized protein YfkK (UPF0435 family)